jgi:hypothetical protein
MILLGLEVVLGGSLILVLKKDWRQRLSFLMNACSGVPDVESEHCRDAFASAMLPPPHLVEGHTHPSAAAMRSSATLFARDMASNMGVDVYSVEMSRSDQRQGLRGRRQWRWAKDTTVGNRNDEPRKDDLVYMCDVDYYVDMPHYLRKAKPVLIYGVVPETAASNGVDDTTFTFDDDGSLETTVNGGGHYKHHLWDYAGDSLKVVKTFCFIPVGVTTYAVERRQVGFSRQLILLSPIRKFWWLSAFLAYFMIDGKVLDRFDPIVRAKDGTKFVRFKVQNSNGTSYTTARPGNLLVATVPAELDEAVATASRLATANLQLPTTTSWLGKDSREAAVVLTEYHRVVRPNKVRTVYPVEHAVRAYAYELPTYNQDERPKMDAFMSPLVHEAFAPVDNAASERRCVAGRIDGLKKTEPKLTGFLLRCIEEFSEEVVGGSVLEPAPVEEIDKKQRRAQQQQSLQRAYVAGDHVKHVLKCFIKAETYAGPKDPRNISTYNDRDKLEMAQFAHSLSEHLKQFEWYGPGKTPVEISNRVASICMSSVDAVNISDYHRMDGTITYLLRKVDAAIFMRAFPDHRPALNELLKTNADNHGVLPKGTTFEQGPSHGSGCSATSVSQTLRAAFTAYLGYRNKYRDLSAKLSHRYAFDSLGIHLGDDGLDADLPLRNHRWAAKSVGLILEAGMVCRGNRGVNFLARYYSPEVWFGRLDSMCDVRRQLGKLHVTRRLPDNVKAGAKLVEKAMGFVATDSNTPVIGEYCRKAVETSDVEARRADLGIASWWSQFDISVQYPNVNDDGWMDAEFSLQFPEFDRQTFDSWIGSVTTADELLRAPLCAEPRPAAPGPVDIIVDGDVLLASIPPLVQDPEPPKPPEEDQAKQTPDQSGRKKRVRRRTKRHELQSCTPGTEPDTVAKNATCAKPQRQTGSVAQQNSPRTRKVPEGVPRRRPHEGTPRRGDKH